VITVVVCVAVVAVSELIWWSCSRLRSARPRAPFAGVARAGRAERSSGTEALHPADRSSPGPRGAAAHSHRAPLVLLVVLAPLIGACALPPPPFSTATIPNAIAKDPILRWTCRTPDGHTFRTNREGYAELPPTARATCTRIAPANVLPLGR